LLVSADIIEPQITENNEKLHNCPLQKKMRVIKLGAMRRAECTAGMGEIKN
jgi:hypothetical protein